jgi:hypothetical protein
LEEDRLLNGGVNPVVKDSDVLELMGMVLTLTISAEAEAKLKAKAAAAGVDVETYAAAIVEQTTKAPLSLREISGPVADDFAKSGMTEDELSDLLEEAKHEMRAEKRGRQAS